MSIAVPPDVRAVVEAERLQRITAAPSLLRSVVIVGVYAAAAAVGLAVGHPAMWLAVWCLQAVILNGAISAVHEGIHGNLAPNRTLDRLLAEFWAAPILLNVSQYRAYHLDHHRWARMEGDPELEFEPRSAAGYLLMAPFGGLASMADMWVGSTLSLFGRYRPYVRTDRQRRAVRRDAVVVLALTAGLVAWAVVDLRSFVLLWGGPILVASPVFTLTVLPEHHGCDRVTDPLAATRSTASNRVFSYLYWENNLHAEHHLLPGVPYHRQHRVSEVLGDRVVNHSPSYLRWHWGLVRELRHAPADEAVIDLRDGASGAPTADTVPPRSDTLR